MLTSSHLPAAHASATFDTGVIPSARRVDYWNRVNTETFSEISVDPRSDSLRGVLELREHGSLKIARVHSTPVALRGGRCTKSNRSGSGLLLHLQDIGSSLNSQLNHSTVLRAGDITFCDAGRPYTVECREPVEITVLKIPAELIARRFNSIDELLALHVDGSRGVGAILASLIRNLWLHVNEIDANQGRAGEATINAVLDLMSLIPPSGAEPSIPSNALALCREMQTYVEARLCDPALSVNSLAQAFNVTPRHVHRVFAEIQTTPSNYILGCRLNFAAARLRDAKSNANVTQIAFGSGFSDCTSFARAFRKKFGITPRDFRHERRTT